jgi:hypothetical protein
VDVSPRASASPLRGYDPDFVLERDAWRRLESILSNGSGGSYGLAGPRGAGKSWLMQHAIKWARYKDGIGVWFPSPSEYEPTAFLASISDVVATAFEESYDEWTRASTRRARFRFIVSIFIAGFVALTAAFAALNVASGTSLGDVLRRNGAWIYEPRFGLRRLFQKTRK